jgi:predicted transcriptional regulator
MLTSYAGVLLLVASDPHIRNRDIVNRLDTTERQSIRIVGELVAASIVSITHEHNRNVYSISRDAMVSPPVLGEMRVGTLLSLLARPDDAPRI